MGEYHKVLVAVDGSDAGTNALRQACRLSGAGPCPVTAVTAYPHLGDTEVEVITPRENISAALRAEALKILDRVKAAAEAEGLSISWMKAVEGPPFEAIVDTALQGRFDLIVMGRRGLNRFERALMGSVTSRVIGHAETDILVVPRDATLSWERILVPTDGSRHSRAAIEKAIDLARAYKSRLDVVSVVDAADEFQFAETPGNLRELLAVQARKAVGEARALAAAGEVPAEGFVAEGKAHEAIASLARDQKTTVVVMGSHGRSGLRRLLLGSVAEKVIGAVSCPVLIAWL
jgi:nucleotide-binding universal stress UspA family protein